jgi:hypothetical protein
MHTPATEAARTRRLNPCIEILQDKKGLRGYDVDSIGAPDHTSISGIGNRVSSVGMMAERVHSNGN